MAKNEDTAGTGCRHVLLFFAVIICTQQVENNGKTLKIVEGAFGVPVFKTSARVFAVTPYLILYFHQTAKVVSWRAAICY